MIGQLDRMRDGSRGSDVDLCVCELASLCNAVPKANLTPVQPRP